MANPLYQQFNNDPTQAIIKQAQELRNNFQGDPREEVQRLLNSGQMSQAQFNQLMPMARKIAAMMPHK